MQENTENLLTNPRKKRIMCHNKFTKEDKSCLQAIFITITFLAWAARLL